MKVAIIGSRGIDCVDFSSYLPKETTLIISGGAKGVDTLAEAYAKQKALPVLIIKPDYQKYGKNAPLIRNRKIVDIADAILAFWDGESHGTIYTVKYAIKHNKPVRLFRKKFRP